MPSENERIANSYFKVISEQLGGGEWDSLNEPTDTVKDVNISSCKDFAQYIHSNFNIQGKVDIDVRGDRCILKKIGGIETDEDGFPYLVNSGDQLVISQEDLVKFNGVANKKDYIKNILNRSLGVNI